MHGPYPKTTLLRKNKNPHIINLFVAHICINFTFDRHTSVKTYATSITLRKHLSTIDMSMFSSTVNEILPFIPQEIHAKTIEVFNRIPGTLLKYFEPKSISKKAECEWQEIAKEAPDSITKKLHTSEGAQRSMSLRAKSSSKYASDKESSYNSELWFNTHGFDYNREWSTLRSHLRDAIKKMFRERNITEVSPGKLAKEIATKCLDQCPSWGRNHQNSSAIVRFNNTYITDEPLTKMNIHAYVYAHLVCEHETSFLFRSQYKTSFGITIEINGISIDPVKLSQFCRLITENSAADSIKIIEGVIPLTWDDLNTSNASRSTDKKIPLTWDDI
ncbi:unnamed protein product [Adineta ricciae]|uniref:Uncharacterized protein n=1 Tax=Adineta ricciae TaxID=249248 RepID=A0A814LHZ4_ADIRI|nr:unnamed protein product [Adineta ricciae]